MDKVVQAVENHKNMIQTNSSTIASIGLTKTGYKIGGILVTPAVWVLNYTAQGSNPDRVDIGLYAMGFFGATTSVAAIGTGVVKAAVDDRIDAKLREVRLNEDSKYRKFIKPCYRYASMAPQINATTIASKGGTAWKHPNGLWVYITDIKGYLVNDYKPKVSVVIYQPNIPLKQGRNGRFLWGARK